MITNISNKSKKKLKDIGKKETIKLIYNSSKLYNLLCDKCKWLIILRRKRTRTLSSRCIERILNNCDECRTNKKVIKMIDKIK